MTSPFPECMFNYEQYMVVLAMCLCPHHGFTLWKVSFVLLYFILCIVYIKTSRCLNSRGSFIWNIFTECGAEPLELLLLYQLYFSWPRNGSLNMSNPDLVSTLV